MTMAFDDNKIPALTLGTAAAAAPETTASAAMESAPSPSASAQKAAPPPALDESQLTPEERKVVAEFSKKIDLTDSAVVMQYGSAAQQKIAQFSDDALSNVRVKDFGELGDALTNLIAELKGIQVDEQEKGFRGLFKKTQNKIETIKTKYGKTEASVNTIVEALEAHQIQLLKDAALLDRMYAENLNYFKELTMYIIAGKKRLEEERETTLKKLLAHAAETGLPEDAQKANDFASMCDRFEKKLHDLELTRMVSVQMAPQIRLVQNNDILMSEKIQSTIVNTIPLWKSQMVITLGLAHSAQAMQAQRAVTDMTNELLRKNAEALHQGTVDVARESERGIVDIETLTQTNAQLIATLDEVRQIQDEGREKRRAAEIELRRIEDELRKKLLTINTNK
jgi:uncharacterized protein YaaN involved in tellurite resistance